MESSGSVLEPKAVFFCTPQLRDRKDWEGCFYLKAAAVYSIITGRQHSGDAVPVANKLLISIADSCASPPAQAEKAAVRSEISPVEEDLGNLSETRMKAIDAVYVVVGVLHDLKDKSGGSPNREKLDALYASSRQQDAMVDVVKIGNQLPLSLLMDTIRNLPSALKKAIESVEQKVITPSAAEGSTLISSIESFKLGFGTDTFPGAVHLFCWYISPFYSTAAPAEGSNVLAGNDNLLGCLYSTLVNGSGAGGGAGRVMAQSVPTASRLVRSGIRLEPAGDGKVRIQFSDRALRVPAMVFDHRLEAVVATLLAWERSLKRGGERPVARYVALVRELVEEVGDVRVLGRSGVLRGRWWKEEGEVVGFLRRVGGLAAYPPAYSPLDDVVGRVREVHEERMRMFLVRNRPALVWASSAAAVVSLLATAVFAARARRGRGR